MQHSELRVSVRLAALILLVAMLAAWPASRPAAAEEPAGRSMPTDQIIVKFKPGGGTPSGEAQSQDRRMAALSAAADVKLQYVRPMSGEADVLRLPRRMPPEEARLISQRLMSLPEVEYAEPDSIVRPTFSANDPFFGGQWNLRTIWGIDIEPAWDIAKGSSNITVAVIDTGLTAHNDLAGRSWPGYDFIHDPYVANDGGGRDANAADPGDWVSMAESQYGYFYGCPAVDSSWQGTHIAGIIAANVNNGLGIAGIDWKAKILPVRVIGKCGGYISDLADGIRWAGGLSVAGVPANAHPANVLNISVSGYDGYSTTCGTTLQSAVNAVLVAKKTVVVTAGDDMYHAANSFPGNCTGVITVAATSEFGSMSDTSNWGQTVEISAPGGNSYFYQYQGIYTTGNTGLTVPGTPTTTMTSGASMAAAHVSGVVSLMYSMNPSLTKAQILSILQSSAKDFLVNSGCWLYPDECGAGILDADGALGAIQFKTWAGSLLVTSDRPVVAVARPHVGAEVASYGGAPSGGLTAYVPMLFKGAFDGSYNSAFYVQNMVEPQTANITIKFYDSAGTLTCSMDDTLAAWSSKGYWVPAVPCLPAGWVGGAVVTSDQNITAVGRPHTGAEVMTYNGFSAGSLTSYLPMLFKKAYREGFDSAFYVQNVNDASTAAITINFYDSEGNLACDVTDSIPPLASKGYWVPDVGCLPEGWVGSAVVISDQDIVTVARPHLGDQVTTYSGFAGGSSNMYVPMLFKNAWGSYQSAFYVQNVDGSQTATLSIEFYDNSGNLTCTLPGSVPPLASGGWWAPSIGCLPDGWAGGAIVRSDQPIVAVGRPHVGAQVTTYPGVPGGGSSAYIPMLFNGAFGGSYNSAVYVQNTDTANPANVTLRFYDEAGKLMCTINDPIPAKATVGYWLPSVACE